MTDDALRNDDIDALRFWVTRPDEPAYEVDLREFAWGGELAWLPAKAQASWTGDYEGRPGLAHQFAAYYRLFKQSSARDASARAGMRNFFRYLDFIESLIQGVDQLSDFDGQRFKTWLEVQRGDGWSYRIVKPIIDGMRQIELLRPLLWPARARDPISEQKDIDSIGMQRLYNALKADARSIKAMFAEGEALRHSGRDPRRAGPNTSTNWHRRENHAWLVGTLTARHLPTKREFLKQGASGLNNPDYDDEHHPGPDYLAPGMSERGREGIVGKLRWFHPSYQDTAVFLWLFCLGTGWNLATALGVDISRDEEWCEPHPSNSDITIRSTRSAVSPRSRMTTALD